MCDVCITCEDDAGSPRDRPDGRFLLDTQVTRWTNVCLPRARLFTDVNSVNSAYLHFTETLSNPILTLLGNTIILYIEKYTEIKLQQTVAKTNTIFNSFFWMPVMEWNLL